MKFHSYPVIFALLQRASLSLVNRCWLKFIAERAELGGKGGVAAGGPQSKVVPPIRLRRRARLAGVAARHPHAATWLSGPSQSTTQLRQGLERKSTGMSKSRPDPAVFHMYNGSSLATPSKINSEVRRDKS